MRRIVLFGASGFLGSAVLGELRRRTGEYELLCLGRRRVPGVAWAPFDLAKGSMVELASLLSAWRPTAVINCTGKTTGTAAELAAGNVATVETLIGAVLAGCPKATAVHLGSAAEYGPTEKHLPTRESHATQPVSDYGVTKLRATELLLQASRDRGMNVVVLRVFNPIGAGISADTVVGNAAEQLAAAAVTRERKIVLGRLDAYRDFIGASEVARAVRLAADCRVAGGKIGTVINIGSGRARQVRDLVRQLCEVAGFTGTVEERSGSSSRSAAVSWQVADVGRACEVLNWDPSGTIITPLSELWKAAYANRRLSRQLA